MNRTPHANAELGHAWDRAAAAIERLGTAVAHLVAQLEDQASRSGEPPAGMQPSTRYSWDGKAFMPLAPRAPPLLVGLEREEALVRRQLDMLAKRRPAHDMLLWGARGTGKSALIRRAASGSAVALIGVAGPDLATLPALFRILAQQSVPALVWIDDFAAPQGSDAPRRLRTLLDGGVAERPPGVLLAVTSNHRLLLDGEPADGPHPRDREDDRIALADRFGLVLGFHRPTEAQWLEMAEAHCRRLGVAFDVEAARAHGRGASGLSGRLAEQFAVRASQAEGGSSPA